jgi:hypothetical protein
MGQTLLTLNEQPLSTLARVGCFIAGLFSLSLGLIAFGIIAVIGGVLCSQYQRTHAAKTSDAVKFFGYGLATCLLVAFPLYMLTR